VAHLRRQTTSACPHLLPPSSDPFCSPSGAIPSPTSIVAAIGATTRSGERPAVVSGSPFFATGKARVPVTVKERATKTSHDWSTWPSPGIPTSPEAWLPQSPRSSSLLQSASVVALAFVVSRVLGLAREVIIAHQFGTSGETSAYVAAFRIPDLLFLVIMAGSFGSAFIPVFSRYLLHGDNEKAWALASAVINAALVATIAGAAITVIAARPLVHYVVAPDLAPQYQDLTVDLMRVLILSPILLGLGIAAKGILEAQDLFILPALAPLIYNLAIIVGALFLTPFLGIFGLAVGVVAGAFCHILVQMPGLARSHMRYRPRLNIHTEGLSDVVRLLLPRLVGQAAFQVNFIVVTSFASGLGAPYISALNFAWQLLMLPHGVVALSVSTVIFPTMSRLYGQGRTDELRATFGRALRPVLFLTLPASVGLFFFRTAIVQTIFQSGAFSGTSTALVAPPLALFALGLVSYATVEILTRAFYAMQDTKTPVAAGVVTIVINIALSRALIAHFGLAALAFSLSLTTSIEAVILLIVLRRRLGTGSRRDVLWLGRLLAATAAMAIVAWFISPRLTAATEPGTAPRLVQIALFLYALGVSAGSFLLAAHLLRLPELHQAMAQIGGRLPATSRIAAHLKLPRRHNDGP
jgi:putative peptidoglycan lipid II flippase